MKNDWKMENKMEMTKPNIKFRSSGRQVLKNSSDKNNSYIQQYLGTKICNIVYAFKRERAVKIMIVLHCMG